MIESFQILKMEKKSTKKFNLFIKYNEFTNLFRSFYKKHNEPANFYNFSYEMSQKIQM